jgi:hypothetical protein
MPTFALRSRRLSLPRMRHPREAGRATRPHVHERVVRVALYELYDRVVVYDRLAAPLAALFKPRRIRDAQRDITRDLEPFSAHLAQELGGVPARGLLQAPLSFSLAPSSRLVSLL